MSLLSDVAVAHQDRRIALAQRTSNRVRSVWSQADVDALDASWDALSSEMTAVVAASQTSAARQSASYVSRVASVAGDDVDRAALEVGSFAGVMADGREVGPAMFGAVTTTKRAIGAGMAPRLAFEAGAAFLGVIVKAAINDLGRSADMTLSAGRGYTRYIRVVNPGACSRCAILAGSDRFSRPFQRHPACKCTCVPIQDLANTKGLLASPQEHFDSLSKAEQDRIYTKAGAEAIRLGADPISVVNARRGGSGMASSRGKGRNTVENSGRRLTRRRIGTSADGSPVMGYTTSDATYKGGFRRTQDQIGVGSNRLDGNRYTATNRTRFMPETILELSPDVEMRKVLLRDAGYLSYPIRDTSNNDWIAERLLLQRQDRLVADEFYRSVGISLS